MNKLEKYRDIKKQKIAEEVQHPQIQRQRADCYEEGFNQALSLDLPVKFAEYLAVNGIKPDGKDKDGNMYWMKYVNAGHTNQGTTVQLYQYWIENIYKPE